MKGLPLLSLLLLTCTLGIQEQCWVYFLKDFEDGGLQTSEDAKFYALSTRFKPFSNENETLVVQVSVKHKQVIDCGGGYMKLFPDTLNQEDMYSESYIMYYIMFGPDICGFGNNKVQVILHYQGKYHQNKTIKCRINKDTHLYTLIIRPSATYEVKIDNKQEAAGDLEDNWNFLPPRKIKDSYAQKPRKWDEHRQIEDTEDKKPEDRRCVWLGSRWGFRCENGRRRLGKIEQRLGASVPQEGVQLNTGTQKGMREERKQLTFVKDLLNLLDWEDFEYIPDPDSRKPED